MLVFLVACAACCTTTAPAEAQDLTAAASIDFLAAAPEIGHMAGWVGAVSPRPRNNVSFVAEASGEYSSESDESYRLYTLVAGPKFTATSSRARPFFQIPLGLIVYTSHSGGPFRTTHVNTTLLVKPGGGVDLPIRDHFGLRLEGDWFVFDPFYPQAWVPRYVRFAAGVTYRR